MPEYRPAAWGLDLRGGNDPDADPESSVTAELADLPRYDGTPIPTDEPFRLRREDLDYAYPDDGFDYLSAATYYDDDTTQIPWRQKRREDNR